MKILDVDTDAGTLTVQAEPSDRELVGLSGEWRSTVTDKPALTIDGNPPTVEEALHRLRGRRAQAIEVAAKARVVEETRGQNRKTRRNNLRLARLEVKARRAALTDSETTDEPLYTTHDGVDVFADGRT